MLILVNVKMNQKVNKKYKAIFENNPEIRYVILMGGRGAGRSTVASQNSLTKLRGVDYYRAAIMRLVLSDVRNSIFQDISDRIEEQKLEDEVTILDHALTFKYGKNRINGLGFRKSSGDQKSKLKSLANYSEVLIEEADEISEPDFIQLDDSLRTTKSPVRILLNLNPPDKNHWIIKRWFNLEDAPDAEGYYIPKLKEMYKHNTIFIYTNYLDNIANITETSIANYENYKITNPDHYYNMIKGYVSQGARGRIFKNWTTMAAEEFDKIPYPTFYGLDFGFSNHPTALVAIKVHNNNVWLKELIYEKGLTNPMISKRLAELGVSTSDPIYADSAEPKSIVEIAEKGWNILPALKGPDSINVGIDMMLGLNFVYTEDSANIALENEEYKWALDQNKEPTNKPIDDFNHLMDAARYGLYTHSKEAFIGFV